MKLPPLPAVPIPEFEGEDSDDDSYTDLPPLAKWTAVVDRKPIMSAKFCKSVAFDGNIPIEHERVLTAMIGHLAVKDETIGGKLPDVGPWMANLAVPLVWMTSGKVRVNHIADKIGHSLHLCRDSEQYASSNFLVNPVSDREDVNTYGARVFLLYLLSIASSLIKYFKFVVLDLTNFTCRSVLSLCFGLFLLTKKDLYLLRSLPPSLIRLFHQFLSSLSDWPSAISKKICAEDSCVIVINSFLR